MTMVPRVKICGLTSAAGLNAAITARASYAGFVFYPPSPRHLTLEAAAQLGARAEGSIQRVGLFVDADDDSIAQALDAARLDILQLHGSESPERCAALRQRFHLPVWKALPVAATADVARANAYTGVVDLVLFDAKTPKGTLPGGMGLVFDWRLLSQWQGGAWGLAGGLSPNNVGEALRVTGASLVDTSSGVETSPGVKNEQLIAAFCRACQTET